MANFINKAIIFDWFRDVYTATGTAATLKASAITKTPTERLRVIRMTDNADITVSGWPGSVVVIEHQYQNGTCNCIFAGIEYPNTTYTASTGLYSVSQTLWEKWWSVWVFGESNVMLLMASS